MDPDNADNQQPWLVLFGIVMAFNTVVFCIAKCINDLSIVDITWGIMFFWPNLFVFIDRTILQPDEITAPSQPMILMLSMVTLWALRLALHIGLRHKGEDFRYVEMKERWASCPLPFALLYCFLFIFGMQGLFSMVNNASALQVMRFSKMDAELGAFEIIGGIVWFIGFVIEIEADRTLTAHRNNPACKGKLIYVSVWRYSRHPNYFGEALLWWGVYIVSCGTHLGWTTFYSCLFITLMIRFVSGVTMLEKK